MTEFEYESDLDREDADRLQAAETLILRIATEHRPQSLGELRTLLDANESPEIGDSALRRAALWSLLSQNRLELTSDRALHVAG
jgi:hypothetical protein